MKTRDAVNAIGTWWTANPAAHEWVRGFAILIAGIIIGAVVF